MRTTGPTLYDVLVEEGLFVYDHNLTNGTNVTQTEKQQSHIEAYNLVFTVTTAAALITFPIGTLLDKMGMWVTRTTLLLVIIHGYYLIALAKNQTEILYH